MSQYDVLVLSLKRARTMLRPSGAGWNACSVSGLPNAFLDKIRVRDGTLADFKYQEPFASHWIKARSWR